MIQTWTATGFSIIKGTKCNNANSLPDIKAISTRLEPNR